jgi:hypothetical protein
MTEPNIDLQDQECEGDGTELLEHSSLVEEEYNGTEALGNMLGAMMSNYFEYEHSDGTTLNIADILLLIRQSIDRNTEVQQQLLEKLVGAKKVAATSASRGK